LNNAEVEVPKSGRVPITLMEYTPIGLNIEIIIEPVSELTFMKSVSMLSKWPSELSIPVYFHLLAYEPQLLIAEKGLILKI
jgi:hypothetical protein